MSLDMKLGHSDKILSEIDHPDEGLRGVKAMVATGRSWLVKKGSAEDPEGEISCQKPIFMVAAMILDSRLRLRVVYRPMMRPYIPNRAVRVICRFGMVERGTGKDPDVRNH